MESKERQIINTIGKDGKEGTLNSSLTLGGAFILESKVSGENSDRYPGLASLQQEIQPLQVTFSQQATRELNEGSYHVGMHTTAQILAFKTEVSFR